MAVPYSTIRPAIFSASLFAAAGAAQLLLTREWAIVASENDHTTDTFQQITGRPPRSVAEFLHHFRAAFV
jgi:hypothetical protein